eukprot:SAG11_NODE_33099_length_279_cov_0.577778_1_plen_43_part_01
MKLDVHTSIRLSVYDTTVSQKYDPGNLMSDVRFCDRLVRLFTS